jgi:hypothetical protein
MRSTASAAIRSALTWPSPDPAASQGRARAARPPAGSKISSRSTLSLEALLPSRVLDDSVKRDVLEDEDLTLDIEPSELVCRQIHRFG